ENLVTPKPTKTKYIGNSNTNHIPGVIISNRNGDHFEFVPPHTLVSVESVLLLINPVFLYISVLLLINSLVPLLLHCIFPSVELATPAPVPTACNLNQATCMNGECIPKSAVCDGDSDCSDASDEMRCNPLGCEPNEFQCDNKRCVLKTWICDSDDDCGDGSDERNCGPSIPGALCNINEYSCQAMDQCIPKSFHCDGEVDCRDMSDEVGCSKPTFIESPPRSYSVQVTETFTLTCRAIGVPVPTVIWRLNWGHVPDKCTMTR
ncbi:hypothetical protein HAZT_HAZT010233, partial [Hyalella azteca]